LSAHRAAPARGARRRSGRSGRRAGEGLGDARSAVRAPVRARGRSPDRVRPGARPRRRAPRARAGGAHLQAQGARRLHERRAQRLIFVVSIPPLLYRAALTSSWRDLRANVRPITLLAVGLVVFTTVVVGVAAHALAPGLPWAAAFALGALVSPPDAPAATAFLRGLVVPGHVATIL